MDKQSADCLLRFLSGQREGNVPIYVNEPARRKARLGDYFPIVEKANKVKLQFKILEIPGRV
jgi:hypothetical protein